MSNWQAQTGKMRSMPKLTNIKGDDSMCLVYRNMGNNHAYPFIWSDKITHNGTSTLVASGIKFHGLELATDGHITATPTSVTTSGAVTASGTVEGYWVEKDVTNNMVNIRSTASMVGVTFDVMFMLGADADVSNIYCRGNHGASQSLP